MPDINAIIKIIEKIIDLEEQAEEFIGSVKDKHERKKLKKAIKKRDLANIRKSIFG